MTVRRTLGCKKGLDIAQRQKAVLKKVFTTETEFSNAIQHSTIFAFINLNVRKL